jgi:DNA-binding response OmpR family regulator
MAHALIIGSDPVIKRILEATLEYGGSTASSTTSVSNLLDRLETDPFDVILLDMDFVNGGGVDQIRRVRSATALPLIALASESGEAATIAALEAGADHFVPKPFMPRELIARIGALTRPHRREHRELTRTPSVEYARSFFTSHRGIGPGTNVDTLWTYLATRKGEWVTGEELSLAVWGSVKIRNLRDLISELRLKLKLQGQPYEIIHEHGRGYRLIVPVVDRPASRRSQVSRSPTRSPVWSAERSTKC